MENKCLNTEDIKSFLINCYEEAKKISTDTRVCMLCNTKNNYQNENDYSRHSMLSEYLSTEELSFLMHSLQDCNFYVEFYPDIISFIGDIISGKWFETKKKYNYVYATTQRGITVGKDSIAPSFCTLMGIDIIGSDGYISSLMNNKYHYTKLLEAHDILVPRTWSYNNDKWLISPPDNDLKVIIKLTKECASVGIDNNSVFCYSPELEYRTRDISKEFSQQVIVQEFIDGYEVEVPLLIYNGKPVTIFPVGISIEGNKCLGDKFLTYDSVYDDNYNFYNFATEEASISKKICKISERVAKILNLDGYARIDFRIDALKNPYITDINHIPHIVEHSSFAFMFQELGIGKNTILPILVWLKHKSKI
jgi:D-alanine-D-alanine ligase